MTPATQADIVRSTLSVLFIGILITVSFLILRPFLTALVWGAMIVITTWPLLIGLQKRLLGKRWLATTIMTLALLLILIVPLTLVIMSVIDRSDQIAEWIRALPTLGFPPPPGWLEQLPMAGPTLAERWRQAGELGQAEFSQRVAPHAKVIVMWLLSRAGGMGMMIVQFLLTVIISAVLYSTGEKAAHGVLLFARKLSGQYGEDAAVIAGKTVRSVALGVVVTALLQALLGGGGLWAAGIPAAMILTVVIFVLCIAQVGPMLVFIPTIVWLYYNDEPLWGTVMIVWALVVGTMDNFIRPVLIRKGADLPLLLIFAGVIGGLVAFGVVGLFIGPVMLAVTYNLLRAWVMRVEAVEQETAHPKREPAAP